MSKIISRCPWVPLDDSLYLKYHDEEWGVPVHAEKTIFEFLVLEVFQAGLSWRTVLHKRQHFKKAFAGFEYRRVAQFDGRQINALLKNAGIIRNRLKIEATIHNAQCFLEVQKEFGTFAQYMWSWVHHKPIVHSLRIAKNYPVHIPEAIAWSKDLKKRGFKFLGPTVVYAHMQATGMVNDHVVSCFRYR